MVNYWIKNSSALIESGDEQAIAIFEEYNQSVMTAFPTFSDDDVRDILATLKTLLWKKFRLLKF